MLGRAGVTININNKLVLPHPKDDFKFLHINPKAKVVVIKLFPGINAKYLAGVMKVGNIHGIILETFGIGDAPTDKSFLLMIKELVDDGTVIINVSQCLKHDVDQKDYQTGFLLEKLGVISGKNMTTEAALAKLYFLLSNMKNPTMKMMQQLIPMPMRGELN
jgi:L-asparaginase